MILLLSVSPIIIGFGKLALGAILVEAVRACAKETDGKTVGAGGGITLATLGAIAREDILACQSNMVAEIGSRKSETLREQKVSKELIELTAFT